MLVFINPIPFPEDMANIYSEITHLLKVIHVNTIEVYHQDKTLIEAAQKPFLQCPSTIS